MCSCWISQYSCWPIPSAYESRESTSELILQEAIRKRLSLSSFFRIVSQKLYMKICFPETFHVFHSAYIDLVVHTFLKEQAKKLIDCTLWSLSDDVNNSDARANPGIKADLLLLHLHVEKQVPAPLFKLEFKRKWNCCFFFRISS